MAADWTNSHGNHLGVETFSSSPSSSQQIGEEEENPDVFQFVNDTKLAVRNHLVQMDDSKMKFAYERQGSSCVVTKKGKPVIVQQNSDLVANFELNTNFAGKIVPVCLRDPRNMLFQKLATMEIVDQDGDTLLICAARGGNTEIVCLLTSSCTLEHIDRRNKWGRTALIEACINGHRDCVQVLVDKGANLELVDNDGDTVLIRASRRGHKAVVELLVGKNLSILNHKNYLGRTALMEACKYGHEAICIELIIKGADIDIGDTQGDTLLIAAARQGCIDLLNLLLSKNPTNLDEKDQWGRTALFEACRNGNFQVCESLLDHGANPETADIHGDTVLILAAKLGRKDLANLFVSRNPSNLEAKNQAGRTALAEACANGHLEVAVFLIGKGADVATTNSIKGSLLMMTVRGGHKAVVNLLLSGGVLKIDDRNSLGQTALMIAYGNGHDEICRMLIEKGADLEAVDNDGDGLLMKAAQKGDVDMANFLISRHHSCVNRRNKKGRTALMEACANGEYEFAKLLIAKGADVNQCDVNEDTPLMEAIRANHLDIVIMLLSVDLASLNVANKLGRTALAEACDRNHEKVCKLLILKGAQINVADNEGDTPLIIAVRKGCLEASSLVLNQLKKKKSWFSRRKILEQANNKGVTAIMEACTFGRVEICELLLGAGALFDKTDEKGETPLMKAAAAGCAAIVEKLLKKDDSTLDQKDVNGRTALFMACSKGHEKVCGILLKQDAKVTVADREGNTPLIKAVRARNSRVVSMLLERVQDDVRANRYIEHKNKDGSTAIIEACKKQVTVQKVLVQKGEVGEIVVGKSTCQEDVRICKILIEKGANLTACDNESNTPLIHAALAGKEDVIRFLLNETPINIINQRNRYGLTALDCVYREYALHGPKYGDVKMILRLFLLVGVTLSPDPFESKQRFLKEWKTVDNFEAICDVTLELRRRNCINWKLFLRDIMQLNCETLEEAKLISPPNNSIIHLLEKKFPRSLQAACRVAVLQKLPRGLMARQHAIAGLGVPATMTNYLNFNDLL